MFQNCEVWLFQIFSLLQRRWKNNAQVYKYIRNIENILHLSQKYLIFEISVAKETLITRNFIVYFWRQKGLKFLHSSVLLNSSAFLHSSVLLNSSGSCTLAFICTPALISVLLNLSGSCIHLNFCTHLCAPELIYTFALIYTLALICAPELICTPQLICTLELIYTPELICYPALNN